MAANPEWYYSKDNEQVGPITAAELKELALSGQISSSDFIWNEQWPEWKAAGSIKGFFPAPKAKPSPPPIPPASVSSSQPKSANVTDTVKSDLSDFVSSAKKVKDLAVAHTRRTQITQMTLPKAYLALGKDVFSNERFRDEFSDLFQQIAAKNDEIAKVSATNKERPQATDFKGKLQSGAANLMAQGQSAKLGFQRDTLVRELGKKAFESHGEAAGPPELISPIASAKAEVEKLDTQINATPTTKSVPLWQRVSLAALLTVICFPVGLYFVWHNPRLSRRTKTIWIGGFAALILCGMIITRIEHEAAKSELAAATQLWDAGDKPAAISKYREVVKSHLTSIPKSERSLVMGRVIDFDAESGNAPSVQELLKQAEDEHIVPSVSSEKARSLQEKWLTDRKQLSEHETEAKQPQAATVLDGKTKANVNSAQYKKGHSAGRSYGAKVGPEYRRMGLSLDDDHVQTEVREYRASTAAAGVRFETGVDPSDEQFWKGFQSGYKEVVGKPSDATVASTTPSAKSPTKASYGKPVLLDAKGVEDLIDHPNKFAGKILIMTAEWNGRESLRQGGDGSYWPFEIGGEVVTSGFSSRRITSRQPIKIRISSSDVLAEFKSINDLPSVGGIDKVTVTILFDGDFDNCRLLTLKRK